MDDGQRHLRERGDEVQCLVRWSCMCTQARVSEPNRVSPEYEACTWLDVHLLVAQSGDRDPGVNISQVQPLVAVLGCWLSHQALDAALACTNFHMLVAVCHTRRATSPPQPLPRATAVYVIGWHSWILDNASDARHCA